MSTQFKLVVADEKVGTARQTSPRALRPWNVPEKIRDNFRRVRSTLPLSNPDESLCIAVSSTCRGEGVSWVTAMLTCAIAEDNHSVLLIDYNRARPSQKRNFGVDQLTGEPIAEVDGANLYRTSSLAVGIMTPANGKASGKDSAFSMRAALPSLRQSNKVILIDCEATRESSDLLELAPATDGVIFVVEAERERREVVARNLEWLRRAGLRVFGVVLNKRKRYIPGWLYGAI
jgi:Mrp family chromosome partitioning ATPase